MKISDVKPYENNPRDNEEAVEPTAKSIKEFGWQGNPIIVDKDHVIIAGHTRYKAAKKLGMKEVPVVVASKLTPEQVKALRLADNKTGEIAEWDDELLDDELNDILDIDMSEFGFDLDVGGDGLSSFERLQKQPNEDGHTLADDFIVFPSSVLDSRKGPWQERKNMWKSLGIKSEIGRDEHLTYSKSLDMGKTKGTSIFDPALTELLYRWFIPDEGGTYTTPLLVAPYVVLWLHHSVITIPVLTCDKSKLMPITKTQKKLERRKPISGIVTILKTWINMWKMRHKIL